MQQKKLYLCTCIVLSASGLCVMFIWPLLLDCMLSLECNAILYYLWKNVPYEIETKFHFFNWTNPEDIHNVSIKPHFEEVGPYVFLQKEEKVNVVWNDNGTITYEIRRFWSFDEKRNNLSLEDTITNVDPALLGLSYLTRNWNYYIRKGTFMTLSTYFSAIHQSRTVNELLFQGYPQPFMRIARVLPMFKELKLPAWKKFGWMYSRNGTTDFDGVFNMGTGRNGDLGKVYNFNYKQVTGFYDDSCNAVSGYSGQLFSNNLTHDPLEIFSSDLKRKIHLRFDKEEKLKGILGYKYVAANYAFDDGTLNPEHKCFCTGECVPSGLANLSNSRHNSPIFLSLPHFYGADPYYLNLVEGLKPDEEKHDCFFTLEPNSGMPLEAQANVQLNLLMQPVSGTRFFENVPKVFFPILWVHQYFVVARKEVFFVNVYLTLPTASILLGILMILLSSTMLFYQIYKHKRESSNSPINEVEQNSLLSKIMKK